MDVLKKNKDKLIELAERLLEKEVIFKEDLEKIFGKRPFEKFDKLGQEKAIEVPDTKQASAGKDNTQPAGGDESDTQTEAEEKTVEEKG